MDGVAGELDGPVQTAVGTHVTDDAQGEVLGSDPFRHRAVEVDAHGRGNLQPQLALGPQGCHLAATDAGTERPQPSKVRGVRVGAKNDLPGSNHHFFRQDLMTDAAARLEEVNDPLIADKLADLPVVLGMHRTRSRHGMVQGNGHALRVFDPILAELLPDAPDGRRVVVAEHNIGLDIQDLAYGTGVPAGSPGQGLLCECLSGHGGESIRKLLVGT